MRIMHKKKYLSAQIFIITFVLLVCFQINCARFQARFLNADERSAEIFEDGNGYFKRKEYEKAIVEFDKIVCNYPKSQAYEPALYLLTFSYFRINNFERTVYYGERFLKEFPYSNYLTKILGMLGEANLKLVNDYKAAYYLIKFHKQSTDIVESEAAHKKIMQLLSEMTLENLDKLHRNFLGEPVDEHILYYLIKAEIKAGQDKNAERDFKVLVRRFPETIYAEEFANFKKVTELGSATGRAGVLLPLSGKFSRYGTKLHEILKIFNEQKYFSFATIMVDTKSDPVDAVVAAANLIDEKKVDFIIGPVFSIEALGVAGYASARNIPLIIPANIELKLSSLPLVFTPAQTLEQQAKAVARYSAKQLGLVRFAVIFPEVTRYSALAGVFVEEVKKSGGEIVAVESFDQDSITLRRELERIKAKKPEAIFLAMDTEMLINTTPQIFYYGLENIKILGTEAFENEKIIRLGEKYVEAAIFATSAKIDSVAEKELKKHKLEINDPITSKFFQTLWSLRQLSEYERINLSSKLGEVLLREKSFDIWTIKNGEFFKLAEIKID